MDGYAVRADDVATVPARLRVVGEVAAGHPFERSLAPGEAARIFTGGVLPPGADTVVMQEVAIRDGDEVTFNAVTPKGKNVRVAGLDFTCRGRAARPTAGDCRRATSPSPRR